MPANDDGSDTASTSRRRYLTGLGTAAAVGVLGSATADTAAATNRTYFGPNRHLVDPSDAGHQDVEPQVVADAYGTLYAAAIRGVPAGVDVWKSTDSGESWTYLGQPDGLPVFTDSTGIAPGGGDVALATGTPYPGSPGNVYVASLYLGSIYVSASTDGGASWSTVNPISSDVPGVDRQWVAAQGQQTLYMSYHDVETENIDVVKSTDGGQTFVPVSPAIPPTQPGTFVAANTGLSSSIDKNLLGNLVLDDATYTLYQIWAGASNASTTDLDTVFLSVSRDGGLSWTVNEVYSDPVHTVDNIFPVTAVDRGGNVYAVWSNGHDVYYSASPDRGSTWRRPVQVDTGGATNTSIFPWAAAGDDGVLDVTWYATDAASHTVSDAEWRVYFSQVRSALSDPTVLDPIEASDHVIHTGDISEGGFGGGGDRSLADVFYMSLDPCGYAHVSYSDDHDGSLPTQVYTAAQVGGRSAYTHPQTFPTGFYVTGSRSDDASVFTGGQTDEIGLSVTPSQNARVRDVVPVSWTVLSSDSPDVVNVETDASAGVRYVYFDQVASADEQADYSYLVEAPSGPENTGAYTFGPVAVKPGEYWLDVDGTGDGDIVVGAQT